VHEIVGHVDHRCGLQDRLSDLIGDDDLTFEGGPVTAADGREGAPREVGQVARQNLVGLGGIDRLADDEAFVQEAKLTVKGSGHQLLVEPARQPVHDVNLEIPECVREESRNRICRG